MTARPDPAAAALDGAGRCAGTAEPAAAVTGPPEYGRLDRILAEQAASPEAIPPEAERGCFMGTGCLGQHTMVMHVYLEDAVSANLDARHVETVRSVFAAEVDRLRAMVVALESENAAAVSTRSGPRVYRGAPRPRDEGACPGCGRTGISLTPSGRRRMHRDPDGSDCTSSGVMVTDRLPQVDVDPDAAAEAPAGRRPAGWGSLPDRDVTKPGTTRVWSTPRRWSGKA